MRASLLASLILLSPAISEAADRPEQLTAAELHKLEVLLDVACRQSDPGLVCSRMALEIFDKVKALNALGRPDPPEATKP